MSDNATVTWGRFCWHDMVSADTDKAIDFYTGLFGWELEDFNLGDHGVYKMWKAGDGTTMGGFMDLPTPETPPHWLGFVQVEDVEATLARVSGNGGTPLGPVIDIPEIGRAAAFRDPQGGVLGAYQPANQPFSTPVDWRPPKLGVCWNELVSGDVTASMAFYTEVFGWKAQTQEMSPGFEYTVFATPEGMQVAGLMQAPPPHGDMTAWLAHICIDDLGAILERAKGLGARIHTEPQAIPGVGSFALVEDPQGAFFHAFQPASEEITAC